MLVLPGSPALSKARFQLLAAEIAALDGGWQLREVVFAYAVDVPAQGVVDAVRLAALLQPGTAEIADASVLVWAPFRLGRAKPPISPVIAGLLRCNVLSE